MAEQDESASGRRSLMAFVQQGQVLLAIAVAGAGLLFNVNAQRREELNLNRSAVEAARTDAIRRDFRDDPHNTLAEFKATYPTHAYCAALGFFIAENGRLSRTMLDRPDDQVRSMNDALTLEVEALAARQGLGPEAFRRYIAEATARAAAPDAGPGDAAGAGCAAVQAPRGLRARFGKPECGIVLDSFGQNRCTIERWTRQRAAAIRAEQVAVAATPYTTGPPAPTLPPGPAAEPAPVAPAPSAGFPPPDACDGGSPLVFVQFAAAADGPTVETLRERMLRAGWQVAPAEAAPESRTSGDIRIYREAQRPCAEALAAAVAAQPEVDRPIRVISLAGRYAGLPEGQLELWLPALD